ncbi:hypothetical protein CL619_02870 [archaeon]|nr:hypothetical protein [archaeon]|tara:strand:+ start:5606 stop:5947 length:342 start_codon:yes stop_codon:yes gene_type:complete
MVIKEKSGFWWLSIFANPNVHTTIYPNIYVAKGFDTWPETLKTRILLHEKVHLKQQEEVGLWKYLLLYIFVLPLFWNPWRYSWEFEAYTKSGHSEKKAREFLSAWNYGWLIKK